MIDFIKLNISYMDKEILLSNKKIKWSNTFDRNTGEVYDFPIIGEYHNMKFRINPTRIELKGSLHILQNLIKSNDNHNYDDFNLRSLTEIIFSLKSELGIDPQKLIIENLEYGVNLSLWKSPTDLIKCNVVAWKDQLPSKNLSLANMGKFVEWKKNQYKFKIYDKGKQYNRNSHIIRIEKGVIKNEYLHRKTKIMYLNDLLNKDYHINLKNDLISCFDDLTIIDNLKPNVPFEGKDKEIFTNCINPKYWETLTNRTAKYRLRKKSKHITEKYGLDKYRFHLRNSISKKCDDLINCNVLTDSLKPENVTNLHVYKESISFNNTYNLFGPRPSVESTYKPYKKRNQDSIPKSDLYEVKKDRNDKSNPVHNLLRAIKKKVDYLDKIGFGHLVKLIPITKDQRKLLKGAIHLPQWKPYINRIV